MTLSSYEAKDLFQWLIDKEDILILDVRNSQDFNRFQVESPYPFAMINVSYYDFMEMEEESVSKIPQDRAIRIVCAKEGSAKYVGEILIRHGFNDVRYLSGGIKTWGNLLVPRLVHREGAYSLYQFIRPGKASCSYGLLSGGEMMLFDPSRNIESYIEFANSQNCRIIKTFETHLQADYIAGSRLIAETTGAQFWANHGDFKAAKTNHRTVTDGEAHCFSKGGPGVRVMFTPGHTPGSTSYLIDNKFMISGDTVFIQSIGRPDLGGKAVEWAVTLFATLQKIVELDDALKILPGHYMDWSEATDDLLFCLPFGQVKERNRDIYAINNVEDFIRFIQDNMRPQPPEYGPIRLANANLEQFDPERQEELDLGKNECAATAYAKAQAAA